MNLLGAALYDPAGAVSKATSSLLAMTAFDTTNLRIAFTIPASGIVRVRMGCVVTGATTFPTILLGVLEGSTVRARVAPKQTLGNTAVATAFVNAEIDCIISGLTPGAVNWDAAYGVETVIASTNIKYGGPNDTTANNAWGAFYFEIWDPKPNPTNFGLLSIDANGRVDVIKVAGTTQTARDIGASVLLSSGTGTGQLDFTSGVVKANATQWLGGTIPAVNVTGVPLVDAKYLLGTIFATPATAGILDANVKNINNTAAATPGASGGVLISGSNSGTTTLGALTVTGTATLGALTVSGATTHTGATTFTGNVTLSDGLTVSAPSTADRAGITVIGNGAGAGAIITGGATGNGVTVSAGATSGHGIISTATGTSKNGLRVVGSPTTGEGLLAVGGSISGNGIGITTTDGHGISAVAAGTPKHGIYAAGTGGGSGGGAGLRLTGDYGLLIAADSNNGIDVSTTSGHGVNIAATGASKHGLNITGGSSGTSDGMKLNAGSGGVALRALTISGTITGNLVGTVSTLTTYTGNTVQTGDSFARIGVAGAGLTNIDLPDQTMNITGDITGNLSGSVGSVTGLTASNLDTTISSRMATYTQPTGFLAATFPGTVASPTNITAGTITTVTAVTGLTASNLDATISSRASQTSVDTIDDFVDTEVAAIKLKTDNLPSDPADASDIAGAFSTVNSTLATIATYVDTEVAAIKLKTDLIPASPAAVGDAMTLTAAYDAAKTAATQTSVDDLPTNAELATALGTSDDAVLAKIGTPTNASLANDIQAITPLRGRPLPAGWTYV
jgi:hypothetical protein